MKRYLKSFIVQILCLSLIFLPLYAKIRSAKADEDNPFVFSGTQETLDLHTYSLTCNAYESGWLELKSHAIYTLIPNDNSASEDYDTEVSLWLNFNALPFTQYAQLQYLQGLNQEELSNWLDTQGFFQDESPDQSEIQDLSFSTTVDPLALAVEAASLEEEGIGYVGEHIKNWFDNCLDTQLEANLSFVLGINGTFLDLPGSSPLQIPNNSLPDGNYQEVIGTIGDGTTTPLNELWPGVKKGIKSKAFSRFCVGFQAFQLGYAIYNAIDTGEWGQVGIELLEMAISTNPFGAAFCLALDLTQLIGGIFGWDPVCDYAVDFWEDIVPLITEFYFPECSYPYELRPPGPRRSIGDSFLITEEKDAFDAI